jgi:hypothetical protein
MNSLFVTGMRFAELSREAFAPKLAWCEGNIFL